MPQPLSKPPGNGRLFLFPHVGAPQTRGNFIDVSGAVIVQREFVMRAFNRPMKCPALTCVSMLVLFSTCFAGDYSKFRCYRVLMFDTTAAGANVAGDVRDFPLAVALDESNFDFATAKPDGSDLRFTADKDDAPLPHAIEHWEPHNKSALVWVKIPVIRGGRSDQVVFMHWQNPEAASVARPADIFAPKEAFIGVWHLDDEGSSDADGYKDATTNAAHGTGVNLSAGSRVAGRVGKGLGLDYAKRQWVKVDTEKRTLFDVTTHVTFSIWAKARSFGNTKSVDGRTLVGYETMFAKGDNSWRVQKFGVRSWHTPPADLVEICVEKAPRGDLCAIGRTDMKLDTWYHFVGVHDFPHVKLYVNGALEMVHRYDVPWTSGDHPVGIGNQSQFPDKGRQWDGVLDEARVMNVAKDAHWIKLDYESQREGQKLVVFGRTHRRW